MSLKIHTSEIQPPISAIAVHPNQSDKICFGFLDGGIAYNTFMILNDPDKNWALSVEIEQKWKRKLKMAIRAIKFSIDGSFLFVTASNRYNILFLC